MNSLIFDSHDGLLINWIINRVIHHPFSLNANIFYPFQNTLAYSDFHIASAITSFPFVLIFKEPLLSFNINFLLGFILTAFSTYLLVKHLTKDLKMALLAGTLFSFGTIHLNYMAHLQLFDFWPFIFTVYFFSREKMTLFVLFFVLSVATMPLFFFFFLAFFLTVPKKNWRIVLVAFVLSTLIFIPYFLVSREFDYVRPITDAIHNSLKIYDFLEPSKNSRLFLFTGLSTLIVVTIFLLSKPKFNRFLLLALVSLILAFGPAFHVFKDTVHVGPLPAVPLPYLVFYYLLPGFSGFRTPSRWILLAFFSLVVGLSIALKHKLSNKIIALLVILIILEVNAPFNYSKVPKPTQDQLWLAKNYKGAPIIQFPIYGWFDGEKIGVETLRIHYSIIHGHPMYNGYSGFSPRVWESDVQWLQKEFPNEKTLTYLDKKGIKLILTPKVLKSNQVKLVKKFPNTYIYALDNNNNQ